MSSSRRHSGPIPLFAVLPLCIVLPVLARAGVNTGGVLLLHAATSLTYSDDHASYCGQSGLVSCEDALVTVSDDPETTYVFYAIAAFPVTVQPRVSGATFGVEYAAADLSLVRQGCCADFELHTPDWPASGAGTAVAWYTTRTSNLIELYWFAAYSTAIEGTVFSLTEHPTQGATFADDSTPAGLDAAVGFGRLGFGEPGYCPPCDGSEPGVGPEEGDGSTDGSDEEDEGDGTGGGGDGTSEQDSRITDACTKLLRRTIDGLLISPNDAAGAIPGIIHVKLARSVLGSVEPANRGIAASELQSATLQTAFAALGVTSITRSVPEFAYEDTLYSGANGQLVRVPDLSRTLTVNYAAQILPDSAALLVAASQDVLWAEPLYLGSPDAIPDDPKFQNGVQWSLPEVGPTTSASSVWERVEVASPAWRIGILDNEVYYNHPELGAGIGPLHKLRSGYDFQHHSSDPAYGVACDETHGTLVTGVLMGLNDNHSLFSSAGGAWEDGLLGPEVVFLAATCGSNPVDPWVEAIESGTSDALPDGDPAACRVVNNSNGVDSYEEARREGVMVAYLRGALLVSTKGNLDEERPRYPADYDRHCVLAVGGSNQDHQRANTFRNLWGSNYGFGLDLLAPGEPPPI